MSLCFYEAFMAKKDGRISDQEYFKSLTAHLHGVRHPDDDLNNEKEEAYLWGFSLFTASFRRFALSSRTLSTEDATLYDELLQHCSAGDLDATDSSIAKLRNKYLPLPLNALAALAATNGHAKILGFCLQNGAEFDKYVDMAARMNINSLEMLQVLWSKNWRDIQHSEKVQETLVMASTTRPLNMLEFLLQKGAKVPTDMFFMRQMEQVSLPMMKALVESSGIGALKGSPTLMLAVKGGHRDVVEYLCKMGAAVNDVPPEDDPREPSMCSPLWQVVRKRDVGMMELLLQNGADPHAPYVPNYSKSIIHTLKERDNQELLKVIYRHTSSQL